jgi:hypothetical protein
VRLASNENKCIQDKNDPGLKNKKIYIFQADNRQMSVSLWDFWKVCHGALWGGTLCAMTHNVQEKKN